MSALSSSRSLRRRRTIERFLICRRSAAAVEFALCGVALFAFLLGIVNLGLLGLTLGDLQHAVEQAARKAAVTAAANGAGECPTTATIKTYFNNFAAPLLPANAATLSYRTYSSGTVTTSANPSNPWVDNASSGIPNGTYLALTATYAWKPIGFAAFKGITLSISTVAFAMGAPTC